MEVKIINESSKQEALFGLGLSYGITSNISFRDFLDSTELQEKMDRVANTLYSKDGGHNKFLESIVLWLDITAPRFWWQEFDTYRVGMTKQSESTIHTISHTKLEVSNFSRYIPQVILDRLNFLISERDFRQLKNELPEGFLQRRIVCTNYKVLRHIISQRKNHKLEEWRVFVDEISKQAKFPLYLEWV
jgi:hypothetical protein